jgi:hypothetical protein
MKVYQITGGWSEDMDGRKGFDYPRFTEYEVLGEEDDGYIIGRFPNGDPSYTVSKKGSITSRAVAKIEWNILLEKIADEILNLQMEVGDDE